MSPDCETVPNYYELLGVPRDVSPEALKRAYREAALKNHPDRGGTHAAMKLVNEAYAILSNPARKAEYDRVLGQSKDSEMFADWVNQTQEVRERAADYPRQWAQFEKWMEGFVSDVQKASYGTTKVWIWEFPTIESSVTGKAFMLVGIGIAVLVLGFLTGYYPAMLRVWLLKEPGDGFWDGLFTGFGFANAYARLFAASIPIFLGAWLGTACHWALHEALEAPASPSSSVGGSRKSPGAANPNSRHTDAQGSEVAAGIQYQVIACNDCGQKLRVPQLEKGLVITCRKCGHKFSHGGPA